MKYEARYIFCSEKLVSQLDEVKEIFDIIGKVPWSSSKVEAISEKNKRLFYQESYNRLFQLEFEKRGGWKPQPILCEKPMLKGDFLKNDVFVEIQFGNSATIFRDYYKFHMGMVKKLLSLAVLITPTNQYAFFPDRKKDSIVNMATFEYAIEHFQALTIPVPILLIGLLPSNV
jgi:hypothetical protein